MTPYPRRIIEEVAHRAGAQERFRFELLRSATAHHPR